jgi:prepilin-type N-terminal cleavage/methylation domain-containing protein
MNKFSKNRSQGGFSLIELLLVLAIIAALAVAAFIVYPRVQAGRNATYESQVLSSAQAGVKALFTTNSYGNLTDDVAYNSELFPKNMNGATLADGITNQWDGVVTVSGADSTGADSTGANTRYFKFTYPNVPTDVCIRLAGAAVNNFGGVFVDAANAGGLGNIAQNTYAATPVALNEANIATGCLGTDGKASITFLSN